MGSAMKSSQKYFKSIVCKTIPSFLATAGLCVLAPVTAQAGNVGWAVSVGGGYGGGYGGAWRPAAYGPGWGGSWGPGWRSAYHGPAYGYPYAAGYYSLPVITYATPPQPMVLASQSQPPVWYYCEASAQYFPYVQSCASGWQTRPAMPPSSAWSNATPGRTQN
jgi:hypothetical protein